MESNSDKCNPYLASSTQFPFASCGNKGPRPSSMNVLKAFFQRIPVVLEAMVQSPNAGHAGYMFAFGRLHPASAGFHLGGGVPGVPVPRENVGQGSGAMDCSDGAPFASHDHSTQTVGAPLHVGCIYL